MYGITLIQARISLCYFPIIFSIFQCLVYTIHLIIEVYLITFPLKIIRTTKSNYCIYMKNFFVSINIYFPNTIFI